MNRLGYYPTNGLDPLTGYGKTEAGIFRGLIQAGIDIHAAAPVKLVIGSPKRIKTLGLSRSRVWLYTMSESTRVSDGWVEVINQRCERVLVPAPELVNIYKDSGVTVPVHFVGNGVDINPPDFKKRRTNPKQFTFLTYSLGDMRKGAQLAIMAFRMAFKDDPRYRMIVKCRDNALWLSGCRNPNTTVVEGHISEARWHKMLAAAHCFVFPSLAEGWGMPPREAVLSGLPTIATPWLGMWDVSEWGYPLEIMAMHPVHFDLWEANSREGKWAHPTLESIVEQMQRVVSDYPAALDHAKMGREYLLNCWSFERFGQRIADLLKEYA